MKPISFNAEMARAVLSGQKTQTRRIDKRPVRHPDFGYMCTAGALVLEREPQHVIDRACPYGQVGDHLYVKETYYQLGHWEPVDGVKTKGGRQKWAFVPDSEEILFEAPPVVRVARDRNDPATPSWHKRLARFMPRKYSRITLEITGIRVEKIQDISQEDAMAEGVNRIAHGAEGYFYSAFRRDQHPENWAYQDDAFRQLWDSMYDGTENDWYGNPWVWVIEFKRIGI